MGASYDLATAYGLVLEHVDLRPVRQLRVLISAGLTQADS